MTCIDTVCFMENIRNFGHVNKFLRLCSKVNLYYFKVQEKGELEYVDVFTKRVSLDGEEVKG